MINSTWRRILLFFSLILVLFETKSQDIQFSMFYAVPLYINPAFAGSRHTNRAMFHHRWQWYNQPGKFYTALFSFDTYSAKYNSGFGVLAIHDYGNPLTVTQVQLQYAYELRINAAHTLRFGIQGGFLQTSLTSLSLPKDFDPNGTGQINANSFSGTPFTAPDISAGLLWYARSLYVSVAVNHMNRPRFSFFNDNDSRWPVKFTLAAGYKIPLKFGGDVNGTHANAPIMMAITPTITYKKQMGASNTFFDGGGSGDQVDLGVYYTYKWLISGLWYRGIPFKTIQNNTGRIFYGNESVVFLLGASYLGIGFAYAYDLTVSSQGTNTGGSHEINLSYVFRTKGMKKPIKSLPCPDFEYDIIRKGSSGVR